MVGLGCGLREPILEATLWTTNCPVKRRFYPPGSVRRDCSDQERLREWTQSRMGTWLCNFPELYILKYTLNFQKGCLFQITWPERPFSLFVLFVFFQKTSVLRKAVYRNCSSTTVTKELSSNYTISHAKGSSYWGCVTATLKCMHLETVTTTWGGSVVKNLPVVQETWVQSLGQEDPLEKETPHTPVFLPG